MEIHIYRFAWFVVTTTNNKRNFDNFRFKLRVGVILWLAATTAVNKNKVQTGKLMLYFPIYERFTLKYCSALGPSYMSKLLRRVIRTFTASWCCNETNCQKYGDNEWRLCQHRHWQIPKNQKKATTARKTFLNKDASDQCMARTDSNSTVLKIKAPVP